MTGIDSIQLRVILRPLVAALQLFALYVLVHGHASPGGGFQGGTLLGASMLLPALVEGERPAYLFPSERTALQLAAVGLLIYAFCGLLPLLLGGGFLDYARLPLPGSTPERRYLGILLIETGVMLAVAGVVVSIFHSLWRPGRS